MIFYKAIKYSILDYCIEKIFNQLSKNLSKPPVKLEESSEETRINFMELEEGTFLSKIVIFVDPDIRNVYGVYKNCTIHVMHKRDSKYTDYWYLEFSYQSASGAILASRFPNILAKDVHFYA